VAALPTDLPVYGIQSRALCTELGEYDSVDAMAEDYAALIEEVQPRGDCRLLGFSLGGCFAASTAHALERRKRRVSLVGLVDADLALTAPRAPRQGVLTSLILDMHTTFSREMQIVAEVEPVRLEKEATAVAAKAVQLPGAEAVELMVSWLADNGHLQRGVSRDLLREYFALFNAHIRLAMAFEPKRIEAPIYSWVQGAGSRRKPAASFDWGAHTDAGVTEETLEGRHHDLMFPPHVDTIAAQLDAALRRGEPGAKPRAPRRSTAPPRRYKEPRP
jgi:thioesterase domain-containing protein